MSETPNIGDSGMGDGWSEPRPLRGKEFLERQRSRYKGSRTHLGSQQECGPVLKSSEMGGPGSSIVITPSEFCLEHPKDMLEHMERSRSAPKLSPNEKWLTPENRQRTWERPTTPPSSTPLNIYLPLRTKDFLEHQRSRQRGASAAKFAYYQKLSSPARSQYGADLLKTPDKQLLQPATNPLSEIRVERPKEFVKPLEASQTASASKIPASRQFLTPENKQKSLEEPKTPEMSCPRLFEPGCEVRPLRTKELLERQRQASITSRSASASKIEPKRTKATVPASSVTVSRLLVPSIGFSYPKDPKADLTATTSKKPPSKLTNTKRNLFHQKEALRQKLERITEEWHRVSEPQLRQLIVDFVNLCLPPAGVECSHLSRECYVNQLIEALQQLQYPREVNKTWLRMPKSQKAISHVLEILRFLLDFSYDEEKERLCVFPIVSDGKQIFEQAAKAFPSGQGFTEQELKESCNSCDIISLQQESENLKLQAQDSNLCLELVSLQLEKQHLQEELANCQAEIKSSTSQSANKLQELGNLYMKKLSQGQLLCELKERVKNQSCSIQDYGKMQDQQGELLQELQLLRLRLQEFSERLRLSQLNLKRCQKEQKESIEAFNVRIRDYEYSLPSESSYPKSLQLSSNATLAEVDGVMQRLKERRVLPISSPVKHISSTHRLPLGENNHIPHYSP